MIPPPGRPTNPGPLETTAPRVEGPPPDGNAPPAEPIALCFGRYRVTGRLGAGSFGVVYHGYDEQLRREVAIKVSHLHRMDSPQAASAYLAEAHILASLDHPGIVPVYDAGRTDDGLFYLVSKLIPGGSLAERHEQGRFPHESAADLVAAVATALHHAHQRGLVHRDVKPGNILLDSAGLPVVVDFGLALRDEDVGTGPTYAGTPAYMSPEQARREGHLVDPRSDVYSLGVVLYELLTGQRPFRADTRDALLEQILTMEPRPPRQVDDAVPRELDRICLRALARRAPDRYSTAADLAEDLRHWLASATGQPGAAAIPDTAPRPPEPTGSPSSPPGDSEGCAQTVVPKGLRSFDAEDADFFLRILPGPRGRGGLPDSVRFWKARLEEVDPDRTFRVGLLYGPSGCGKSSLVKAGLLPRLDGHVHAVYAELTPADAEPRLLRALRRRIPALPAEAGLTEALAGLRRGRWLPQGQKLVLVLDQLEQWLHPGGFEHSELTCALRQCDGGRVQCLLLVRDDFWMTTTRLMRELEVPLLEGQNSAAADLFDPRHARKVLVSFGRAFGALPPGPLTAAQDRFLDQAVAELSSSGKVSPVRLSMFAEMVKGRPWVPATLKDVGGAEGLGVAFLEETFGGTGARPQRRLHHKAARAVLGALLPEPGTDIKGQMRSHDELTAAAGVGSPQAIDDLLRILDADLRLITLTEAECDRSIGDLGGRNYQLAHDYLVPVLRLWLTAKQRETLSGRAGLRLQERAALWNLRPDRRLLPSWSEWAGIRLLTSPAQWRDTERRMMAAATRYHSLRALAAAALLAVVGLAGLYAGNRLEERARDARVRGLIATLLVSDTAQVPAILDSLEGHRAQAADELSRIAQSPDRPARERLRAAMALLPADEGQVGFAVAQMLTAQPDELLLIRERLRPHGQALAGHLWNDFAGAPAEKQLRIAAALAAYDPGNQRWKEAAPAVSAQIVKENPLVLVRWVEALRPAREHFLGPLSAIFRNRGHDTAERAIATSVLATYAAGDPDTLVELATEADAQQYRQLIGNLEHHRDRVVAGMRRVLTAAGAGLPEAEKEGLARRQANAAVTLYRLGDFAPVWPLLRHSPEPRVRGYLIHYLAMLGADPVPLVRRWHEEGDLSVRRGLLLALGGFPAGRLPADVQAAFRVDLRRAYRDDPDPGAHSAAEWLLRVWGDGDALARAKAELRGKGPGPGRSWYLDGEGHTLVLVDGQGRPAGAAGHAFAVATKEVTIEQFLRFRRDYLEKTGDQGRRDRPVHIVSWFDAAAYCRWLSEQEGLLERDMCYPPIGQIKPGMSIPADVTRRLGYRLPAEAEWHLACRAGSLTARAYGSADELLPLYAWFSGNSGFQLHPVGQLRPNDLGMFDMLGNVMEWCQGPISGPPAGADVIRNDLARAVRGGAIQSRPDRLRDDLRDPFPPLTAWHSIGFRVARTIRPGP